MIKPRVSEALRSIRDQCSWRSHNVGADKDSEQRQRAAITGFAKANGYLAMLQRIAGARAPGPPTGRLFMCAAHHHWKKVPQEM